MAVHGIGDVTVQGLSRGSYVLLDYMQWGWLEQGGHEEDAAVRRILGGEPAVQAVLSASEQDASRFIMACTSSDDESKIVILVEPGDTDPWSDLPLVKSERDRCTRMLSKLESLDAQQLRDWLSELKESSSNLSASCGAIRAELEQQETSLAFFKAASARVEARLAQRDLSKESPTDGV
ncbi:hypothetical protein JCM6882_009533 [Rhodosporidiobolus microsporus]